MPELPEVRVHAERIAESHLGATLSGFRALSFTALKTFSPDPSSAVGRQVTNVSTRGKHILIEFANSAFIIHLMQGGRLTTDSKLSAKPRGGLCRWTFENAEALLLTEAGKEHKAGVWVVDQPVLDAESLAHLGPEADSLTLDKLGAILTGAKGARLHGVLRDQRRLAGIGRRLANEICWTAKLSPFAAANKIDADGRQRLVDAVTTCIEESIEGERARSTMVSSKERVSHVHNKAGTPCERCKNTLREVSYNAYTVSYCATCQTGGKVLADNTTSKFLK